MTDIFIEINHSMWVNRTMINKIVRDKFGNYLVLLVNKEKYHITVEKAEALMKLGIVNG